MAVPSEDAPSVIAQRKPIAWILALLAWALCVAWSLDHFRGYGPLAGIDFRSVYSSTRCLIADCNPYSPSDTLAQFLHQGGTLPEAGPPPAFGPFIEYFHGYPPFTLFIFVPFALLPWPFAWHLYLTLAVLLYGLAIFLFAQLCAEYTPLAATLCLAFFVLVQGRPVLVAQPGLLASALCCIAVWLLLKGRHPWVAVISFALSLTIKPHLGGLILFYFLLATPTHRKRAFQIIALTLVLWIPGLLWISLNPATSHHWMHDYVNNVQGMSLPGHMSNPGETNWDVSEIIDLQTIVALFRDSPSFYNPVVWAISLVLLVAWMVPVLRLKPSRDKDVLSIAAIAVFSILPVYHRVYDTRVLLLVFPALALLWRQSPRWRISAAALTFYMGLVASDVYVNHFFSRSPNQAWTSNHRILIVLLDRPTPLVCLVLTLFYLSRLYLHPPGPHAEPLTSASQPATHP